MQSLNRQIKRGHAIVIQSDFVTNPDGSKKLVIVTKSKRGRWSDGKFRKL